MDETEILALLKQYRRETLEYQQRQQQEQDDLANSVTRLVKAIEQDDRLSDRTDRLEQEERDRRHRSLLEAMDDLKVVIERLGVAHRGLPQAVFDAIEKKIYELRVARFEALQAGVPNEPAPLMPAPTYREPTGRIATMAQGGEEGLALTPPQQRALVRTGWWLIKHWWAFALPLGGWLAKWIHGIVIQLKN